MYPWFDPNNYDAYSLETRRNVVITDQYEPGSTFKISLRAAAALELGIASEDTVFHSGPYWQINRGNHSQLGRPGERRNYL